MLKINPYILLLSLVLFAGSCTKNLELTPVSQISNASFWKTQDDVTGALNGMYARFRTEATSNLFFYGEARSETMNSSVGEGGNTIRFYNNILTPVNVMLDWRNLYTVVHDANLILKYAPAIPFNSEAEKNKVLAQAHTMRAFIYFILVRTWGGVPLVKAPTETADPAVNFRARATDAEVFGLIKSDLDKALTLFADDHYPQGRCLWSKPAANALKADVYLWTAKKLNGGSADFTTALNAGTAVLSTDAMLLENYDAIFRYANKGNKEILMSIRFLENESSQTGYQNMYIFPAYTPTNIDQPTKDAIGLSGGTSLWTASATARNQFTTDDQRRDASFREIYTFPAGDPGGTKSYYSTIVYKFRGIELNGQRLFLDDVILYRLADVLLMVAEAKNGLTQDPSSEINLVRKRAYGDDYASHVYVNGSQEQNDNAILKERLLELAFEGKRWWDLVRFDKAFELVPSLQDRADEAGLLLFPISETTMSLDPELDQNPGY